MSNTCFKCLSKITQTRFKGVQCLSTTCKKHFHVKCIEVAGTIDDSLENGSLVWTCLACKFTNQTEINVGNDYSSKSSNTHAGNFNVAIDDLHRSINELSNRFGGVEDSQHFVSNSMDELRAELKTALDEIKNLKIIISKTEEECKTLRLRINQLEMLSDDANQQKLTNNIVISGIPINNHNNNELIMKVLTIVNPEISETDIVNVSKVADSKAAKRTTEIYIVKLSSVTLKTTILNNMKNFKQLSTVDLGINFNTSGSNKIYIMHNLSPLQSKLYKEAKQIKQQLKFRFFWIKNGVIMLRQAESSTVFHIRSFNDIDRIKSTFRI